MRQHFAPDGDMEALFVEDMVIASWRLRRYVQVETATMDKSYADIFPLGDGFTPTVRRQRALISSISNDSMEKVRRYGTGIRRDLYRAFHACPEPSRRELQALQASRLLGVPVVPGTLRVSLRGFAFGQLPSAPELDGNSGKHMVFPFELPTGSPPHLPHPERDQ